jgi:hypothetical protein
MTKRNAENERVKRGYLVYLKDARGRDKCFSRRRRERDRTLTSQAILRPLPQF